MGGIPPAWRNHLDPTAGDSPASRAASSLDEPRAMACQNRTRSSRRAVDGRPGDRISSPHRPDRLMTPAAAHRGPPPSMRCCDDRLIPPNISPSATPSVSRTLASSTRWARKGIRTTTPSPRPSTGSTRPSSSTDMVPGATSSRSSSRPPPGSTGGIRSASTRPAATCHRRSTRPHTGPRSRWPRPPEPYDPSLHETQYGSGELRRRRRRSPTTTRPA